MTKKPVSTANLPPPTPLILPHETTEELIKQAIEEMATDKFEKLQQIIVQSNRTMVNIDGRLQALEEGHGTINASQDEIKSNQDEIKLNTDEILEFLRTARMGTRLLVGLGHILIWASKVVVGAATLIGIYQWMRTGEVPKFLSLFGMKGTE